MGERRTITKQQVIDVVCSIECNHEPWGEWRAMQDHEIAFYVEMHGIKATVKNIAAVRAKFN